MFEAPLLSFELKEKPLLALGLTEQDPDFRMPLKAPLSIRSFRVLRFPALAA